MALVKCRECGNEVSTTAAACPNCGAAVKKKAGGCAGTALAVLVGVIVLVAVSRSCSSEPGPPTNVPGPAAASVTPEHRKAEVLNHVQVLSQAMKDMKVEAAGTSMDAMVIVIETFNAGATAIRDASTLELSADDRAKVIALRAGLVGRQLQTFPLMRKQIGPIMGRDLWEADVTAETFGARYATAQFVGGTFAAHHNIAVAEDKIYPLLMRLRFKRAQYKWIPSEEQYTYYKVDSPADGALAVVDAKGNATIVDDSKFRAVKRKADGT